MENTLLCCFNCWLRLSASSVKPNLSMVSMDSLVLTIESIAIQNKIIEPIINSDNELMNKYLTTFIALNCL